MSPQDLAALSHPCSFYSHGFLQTPTTNSSFRKIKSHPQFPQRQPGPPHPPLAPLPLTRKIMAPSKAAQNLHNSARKGSPESFRGSCTGSAWLLQWDSTCFSHLPGPLQGPEYPSASGEFTVTGTGNRQPEKWPRKEAPERAPAPGHTQGAAIPGS